MKKKIIIGLIISSTIVVAVIMMTRNGKELKMNTTTVREETVELTVTATGNVQPVDKIEVGTQVSGVIERLYVDFNSQVRRGQLLAELDKSTLSERLVQARARVSSVESDMRFAQQNHDRVKQLYEANAATLISYEDAINRLVQAQTAIANAKADLQQAQVNLGYADIYSPIDGVILNRAVEQGQTVAASFSTPTLFTIAADLKQMQVEADIDEADIGKVSVGQDVRFTVDAYPDDVFEGSVRQIRLQPKNISNVITYTVIIEAPNPDEKLFPGMTATVAVIVYSEKGVVIPVSAFNFRPSAEVMEKLNIQPQQEQRNNRRSVWIKNNDTAVSRQLETGLNDGVFVIVNNGLSVGDTIILSASVEKKGNNDKETANLFSPPRHGGPPPINGR